jgi:hypothetical protein
MYDLYHPDAIKVLRKQSAAELAPHLGKTPNPPTETEIAFARSCGVWRDDELLPHDEIIARVLAAHDRLDPVVLANGFVAGLGQGSPLLLSTIASYAIASHLKPHEPEYPYPNFPCAVCGLYRALTGETVQEIFWNSHLLSRIDVGGWCGLGGVMADLDDYLRQPPAFTMSESDVDALRRVLALLKAQPSNSSPGKLKKELGALAGKNDLQRTRFVEILSIIGVLEPIDNPSYHRQWTRYIDRPGPDGRNDWEYPAIWWRGSDGVNDDAVRHWFGHLL